MATKTPMQNDKKIKWKDVASDEENDTFSSKDLAKSKAPTADAEQSRGIKKALMPAKKPVASKPKMTSAQADAAWDRGAGTGLKNGGKTKCMANGGSTGRGDGIASKGKTKCKYV